MDVAIIGSGGREHAFVNSLNREGINIIVSSDANYGMCRDANTQIENIDSGDFKNLGKYLQRHYPEALVLPGSETTLAGGIVDVFREAGYGAMPIVGPDSTGARLESSKIYAKEMMIHWGIPTATCKIFEKEVGRCGYQSAMQEVDRWFQSHEKLVLKADGLCEGKGVVICDSPSEGKQILQQYESSGRAFEKVLFEEFLDGPEYSVIIAVDNNGGFQVFPPSMDHKQLSDGDRQPMTGGMGAVTLSEEFGNIDELMNQTLNQVIEPTIRGLSEDGIGFRGFLYFGMKKTPSGPQVLEFNVRFGDPEAQAVLQRVENFSQILRAIVDGTLENTPIRTNEQQALTVAMVSKDYPSGAYREQAGLPVHGIDQAEEIQGITVQSGSIRTNASGSPETGGGRELYVTASGTGTIRELRRQVYQACESIGFPGQHYRKDLPREVLF